MVATMAHSTPSLNLPTLIVVMGVCGVGKTTVGTNLAKELDLGFIDADDLHSQTAIDKMKAGIPLDDTDRRPWLMKVRQTGLEAVNHAAESVGSLRAVVIACSALKRKHRDIIRGLPSAEPGTDPPNECTPQIRFVHLWGPPALVRQRMERRQSHFMTAQMLNSQLETLEEPRPDVETDDKTFTISINLLGADGIEKPHEAIVHEISRQLGMLDKPPSQTLPPLDQIFGSEHDPESLSKALALLLEPSTSIKDNLVPILRRHHASRQIKSYAELLEICQGIVEAEFDTIQKATFLGSHPRIGEVKGLSRLSSKEQSNQRPTEPAILKRLEELNNYYERVYPGLRYVTFVNGRSRGEIVTAMEEFLCDEQGHLPQTPLVHNQDTRWMAELSRGIKETFMIAMNRLGALGVREE